MRTYFGMRVAVFVLIYLYNICMRFANKDTRDRSLTAELVLERKEKSSLAYKIIRMEIGRLRHWARS